MISSRRSFLIGATASLITAPAIVRAASLMPVRALEIYGRSPALDALNVMREWDDRIIEYAGRYWKIAGPQTIAYSEPNNPHSFAVA